MDNFVGMIDYFITSQATVFINVPIPVIEMLITSPEANVKSLSGTIQVPVIR